MVRKRTEGAETRMVAEIQRENVTISVLYLSRNTWK